MKTYGDLDLKAIVESCDLDFASYTYELDDPFLFDPLDLSVGYWRNGRKPEWVDDHYEFNGNIFDEKKYSYVLFRNFGFHRIKKLSEPVRCGTFVDYRFRDNNQKEKVCRELSAQLGSDYIVAMPKDNRYCIQIRAPFSRAVMNSECEVLLFSDGKQGLYSYDKGFYFVE